jgi:hypothetical protein
MSLFQFLDEHEEALQKHFLITSDYFQHRELYGSAARAILRAGAETTPSRSAVGIAHAARHAVIFVFS